MKKLKKLIVLTLTSIIALSSLTSCNQDKDTATNVDETIIVDFWSAPQLVQYNYWSKKANEFNQTKTKVDGKIIEISVQQMAETPSSEAAIQNSIATGTTPAISENITRGFAMTLSDAGAIYDLSQEDWFQEVAKNKVIESSLEHWAIDGSQYVLPLYVNPMMYQWNMNALKLMGINEPPTTVEDFHKFIKTYRELQDVLEEAGHIKTFYRPSLKRVDQWWERWFDFQMQYGALSGGGTWVEDNKLTLDKNITAEVFELYGALGNTIGFGEMSTLWAAPTVSYIFSINAPWEIEMMREANKVYGLDGDYVYWQPIVKNEDDTPYVFGDSKGLVLYKTENISDEEHKGSVEFVKWLYNSDNAVKTDLDWLSATKMLPVRGNMMDTSEFIDYFAEYPELAGLAEFAPFAMPTMAHENMIDIQMTFTEYGFAPYFEEVEKIDGLDIPDAIKFVEDVFTAMEEKINN